MPVPPGQSRGEVWSVLVLVLLISHAFQCHSSVSLVPVAYYADVILTQARPMVYGLDDGMTATSSSSTTIDPHKIQARLDGTNLEGVLWFM